MDDHQHLPPPVEDLRMSEKRDIQCAFCRHKKKALIGNGPRFVYRCGAFENDWPPRTYERIQCQDRAINWQCPEFDRDHGVPGAGG